MYIPHEQPTYWLTWGVQRMELKGFSVLFLADVGKSLDIFFLLVLLCVTIRMYNFQKNIEH